MKVQLTNALKSWYNEFSGSRELKELLMGLNESLGTLSGKVGELETTVSAVLAEILKDVQDLKDLAQKGIAIQPPALDALSARLSTVITSLNTAATTVDQADKDAQPPVAGFVPLPVDPVTPPVVPITPVPPVPTGGGDPSNPVLIG